MVRLLLALLILAPVAAWADCADSGWEVFPAPGSIVPTNACLIVQGYASSQAAVNLAARSRSRASTR